MSEPKLCPWWWHRQGLDGSLRGATPAEVLDRAGWARSVGGVGPYLTLFARARTPRDVADAAAAKLQIHELPAARGCTYILPASDFAIGLIVGRSFADNEMRVAAKLGVTDDEVERLSHEVVNALSGEPLDPESIRSATRSARSLGEEGKKKGMITTLPLALGRLQARGAIRRVPIAGRLDQQRFKYTRWTPSPLANVKVAEDTAFTELARRFFRWVGPATMKEFQWFAGLGVRAANEAVAPLKLVSIDEHSDRCLLPEDLDEFRRFVPSSEPQYALVSSLDSIAAARRDALSLVDSADRPKVASLDLGERQVAGLVDLPAHAILDRGRLIGFWEYDADAQEIVWFLFSGKKTSALLAEVKETEAYVRDQLGDARSFSLDSPKSRKPKIEAFRRLM